MKILYHHRIASKDGQYVHIEELTQALKRLGHELVIIGPASLEEQRFGAESGAIAWLKRFIPAVVYELLELGYSLIAYRKLSRAVREHRPDCIYERCNLFMLAGIWTKRRYKLPLLLEVNAPLFEERSRYSGLALKSLARWSETYVWKSADRVLPVTEVLATRIRRAGVATKHITVIPNGIDLIKFGTTSDQAAAKQRLGLPGRFVLGFTGFVREWHGLESVVDIIAADQSRNRHLLIVGDGPARTAIEHRAATLGVSSFVTITGVIDRNYVADHVAAFDIALQPEVVPYASPLKLFEYLGLGRPIVAPNQENVREVLSHEHNALLFDPANSKSFATAVERLCADAPLRARLAANARLTIDERGYTWDNNARKVIALFQALGVRATQETALHATPRIGVR